MNEKDEKKLFRKNTWMSIIITIGFLVFSVISGILAEPVNLKDLIKSAKEKEKSRVFLDIKSKEKSQTFESYKSVGIQPAVAGPAVTCKYEAQKANKEKQSASYGVKCPEAVTGQR